MSTLALCALVLCSGCEMPDPEGAAHDDPEAQEAPPTEAPFALGASDQGLLFTWVDDEGPHRTGDREAIPADRRGRVAVTSLSLPKEDRDARWVWVADLSVPRDGYPLSAVAREDFDAELDQTTGAAARAAEREAEEARRAELGDQEVVLYSTSWCGVCRRARSYFESEGIPFEEKDIERDPGAQEEMLAKAREAGMNVRGVPVIDVGGTLVNGFDQARVAALLGR